MTTLEPGDLIVVKTGGFFGRVIRFGQTIRPKWRTYKTKHGEKAYKFNHVAVFIGDGKIIEANPSGVEVQELSKYPLSSWNIVKIKGDRHKAIKEAHSWVGTPYGWKDIVAFFFVCLGFHPNWVEGFIKDDKSIVCSQLGAICAYKAGDLRFTDPLMFLPVTDAQYAE